MRSHLKILRFIFIKARGVKEITVLDVLFSVFHLKKIQDVFLDVCQILKAPICTCALRLKRSGSFLWTFYAHSAQMDELSERTAQFSSERDLMETVQSKLNLDRDLVEADYKILGPALYAYCETPEAKAKNVKPFKSTGAARQFALGFLCRRGLSPAGVARMAGWLGIDDPTDLAKLRPANRRLIRTQAPVLPTSYKDAIYRFRATPLTVITDYLISEYGTRSLYPFDRDSWDLLAEDIRSMWPKIRNPVGSMSIRCPLRFDTGNLILVGGPNGNRLSEQLNNCLADGKVNAFHFRRISEETAPMGSRQMADGPRDFVICHPGFQSIAVPDPEDSASDYGLFYIGNNPADPEYHLIWVAGLGGRGTVAAALALRDDAIQAQLALNFARGARYVSGLTSCRYKPDEDWTSVILTGVLLSTPLFLTQGIPTGT